MQITDEIYQNYVAKVNRYLLSLTHDSDLAEELTPDATAAIESYAPEESAQWLKDNGFI